MLTHASLPGTLPTCLPRASRPSEISRGRSQAARTAALSLRRSTAPGAAVHRDRAKQFLHHQGELEHGALPLLSPGAHPARQQNRRRRRRRKVSWALHEHRSGVV